jgi:anti-sigma factor RsiW
MDHQDALALLPAYVDQELGVADSMAVERHLESCAECRREYAEQEEIKKRLKLELPYAEAPAYLHERIRSALPQEHAARKMTRAWQLSWFSGAVLAALLVMAAGIGMLLGQPSHEERLADEVVASHVRSLQADHLMDVASTDRHTVKPWFNGKLNFSPLVSDFGAQGFSLVGGRLDYLDGHPVAALVYRHNLHPVNLYIWPSSQSDSAPQASERHGYHVMHWNQHGMAYWAISDTARDDMTRLVALLRTEANAENR